MADRELGSLIDGLKLIAEVLPSMWSSMTDRKASNLPNQPTPKFGENAFLNVLSKATRDRITRGSELVPLRVRETLYEPKALITHAYFPTDGAISNVYRMNDGAEVETGIIGREGMVGLPAVLTNATSNSNLYTTMAGFAWKAPASVIADALEEDAQVISRCLRYFEAQLTHFSQYGACNRLHNVDERFSRWLLMAHDRVPGDRVTLTHEFLALMLGVGRPAVSLAAATLKRAGIIDYSRGDIFIADRAALQRTACECYDNVEDRYLDQVGYSIRKYTLDRDEFSNGTPALLH